MFYTLLSTVGTKIKIKPCLRSKCHCFQSLQYNNKISMDTLTLYNHCFSLGKRVRNGNEKKILLYTRDEPFLL